MADNSQEEPVPEADSLVTPQDAEELVRAFGLVFSNTFLYGASHGVTVKATEDCFLILNAFLEKYGDITFALSEGQLLVNGAMVEQKNSLSRMFATQVQERDIGSFGIQPGMDKPRMTSLLEVLNAKPEELRQLGGFAGAVEAVGVQGVSARQVTIKQVTEDETVVTKETARQADDVETARSVMTVLAGGETGEPTEGGESEEAQSEAMRTVASDANKFSELLVKAAEEKKQEKTEEDDVPLATLVVDCLKRGFKSLTDDPSLKTQKGKKNLSKTLMQMENGLVDQMRDAGEDVSEAQAAEISETIGEMRDELTIDGLATEYMKKRSAIEANEKRLMRFIKAKGLDKIDDSALKDKLEEGGLTTEGWKDLLLKSGVDEGEVEDMARRDALVAVGHLAMLLTRMQDATATSDAGAAPTETSPEEISQTLREVDKEVNAVVDQTEHKIKSLVEDVQKDIETIDKIEAEAEKAGVGPSMTRRALLVRLAEIAQELCQPLAVINCSLDMLLSKSMGDITDPQVDMLQLASQSSDKLKVLVDHLMDISGLPTTMAPDAQIQSSIYDT